MFVPVPAAKKADRHGSLSLQKMNNLILGIKITSQSKTQILDKVKKHLQNPSGFFHIVSLNPEIIMAAQNDKEFLKILSEANVSHTDGIGLTLAGKILGIDVGERIAGVDLMEEMLNFAGKNNLRVFFLGGAPQVAEKLTEIYTKKSPTAKFLGTEGIHNVQQSLNTLNSPTSLISQVVSFSPHLLFVSFGSPFQEKWIYENRARFGNCAAMGVGGAFDFLSKRIPRAPRIISSIGGEWLFRLILQPWRIKRQLSLLKFLWLVFREKVGI